MDHWGGFLKLGVPFWGSQLYSFLETTLCQVMKSLHPTRIGLMSYSIEGSEMSNASRCGGEIGKQNRRVAGRVLHLQLQVLVYDAVANSPDSRAVEHFPRCQTHAVGAKGCAEIRPCKVTPGAKT